MTSSETGFSNNWESGSLWDMTVHVHVVTFIGAGGKTTCLRTISQEISSAGNRVIATTTTKVFPEESMKAWKNPGPPPYEQEGTCFWYVDVMEESGKWIGPPVQAVDAAILEDCSLFSELVQLKLNIETSVGESTSFAAKYSYQERAARRNPPLEAFVTEAEHGVPLPLVEVGVSRLEQRVQAGVQRELARGASTNCKHFWVIEGDGAKRLKLKCWEPHEPQIPRRSDCVVLVLDGDLWGKVLQAEHVHRPAICSDLIGQVWNAEQAWRYFLRSPVFAPQYGQMAWVILLNMKVSRDSSKPLLELNRRWAEIQREVNGLEYRPIHLRLAAGNVKEGKLQWFDLW